jgi:hypothetical protein
MCRLKSQCILIAGRVVVRHLYIPDTRCGGMYIKCGRCWHQVGEVDHPEYRYYAARTLDATEAALIEEQVEEAFHQGRQASVK